jgi:hypothetical protein
MGIGARRMFGWAVEGGLVPGSGGRGGRGRLRASGIPVVRRGLIELVFRDGFGSREVEGRGLVEVEFGLGRTRSRDRRIPSVSREGLEGLNARPTGPEGRPVTSPDRLWQ